MYQISCSVFLLKCHYCKILKGSHSYLSVIFFQDIFNFTKAEIKDMVQVIYSSNHKSLKFKKFMAMTLPRKEHYRDHVGEVNM